MYCKMGRREYLDRVYSWRCSRIDCKCVIMARGINPLLFLICAYWNASKVEKWCVVIQWIFVNILPIYQSIELFFTLIKPMIIRIDNFFILFCRNINLWKNYQCINYRKKCKSWVIRSRFMGCDHDWKRLKFLF